MTPWAQLTSLPGRVGDWLAPRLGAWATVTGLVPTGYDAYAVLPNARNHPSEWVTAEVSVDVREVLGRWTAPEQPCVQAAWAGRGELGGGTRLVAEVANPLARLAARAGFLLPRKHRHWRSHPSPPLLPAHIMARCQFTVPNREYLAFAGVLADLAPRPWGGPLPGEYVPAMFWPASQAWVFASDVDLGVSFLAGPAALVDALVRDERLGASQVEPDQPIDPAWSTDLRADSE